MPEMADIEVLKRRFNEEITGQTIVSVTILNPAILKGIPGLEAKLTGKKILESRRYGKYLFTQLENHGYLILHFGLTAKLIFEKDRNQKPAPDDMLILRLKDVDLIYRGGRIFGMAGWTADPQAFINEKELGPDAGAVTEEEFLHIMRSSKGAVKPALLDQHKMAGVGNVYADEILFQAGIHPQVPVKSLSGERLKKIYEQIHRVHKHAVEVDAVRTRMPDWALMKIRKTTMLCPQCGASLKSIQVNSRETIFCTRCQHL